MPVASTCQGRLHHLIINFGWTEDWQSTSPIMLRPLFLALPLLAAGLQIFAAPILHNFRPPVIRGRALAHDVFHAGDNVEHPRAVKWVGTSVVTSKRVVLTGGILQPYSHQSNDALRQSLVPAGVRRDTDGETTRRQEDVRTLFTDLRASHHL